MKGIRNELIFIVLLGLTGLPVAFAGTWPKIEGALSEWRGPRQITLRTDLRDPLSSPEVQELLKTLLEKSYIVIPAAIGTPAGEGLALDLRISGDFPVLTLSRGSDGAILAFERRQGSAFAKPPDSSSGEAGDVFSGLIELSGRPRHVLFLGRDSRDGFDIALLSDQALERFHLSGASLSRTDEFRPPLSTGRALFADAGDLTGDGSPEIAAVWAEDVGGIYEGTDSRIHTWILGLDGNSFHLLSPDLQGYARILGGGGYLQQRGVFAPFAGGVFPLLQGKEGFAPGQHSVSWGQGNLFGITPSDGTEAIAWDKESRLHVVSVKTGEDVPGALALQDLGDFKGTEVAVRLESPEYRSGFEKEDRVKETYHALPPRVATGADGAIYTIVRGRARDLPLLGKPSGKDQLVRIKRRSNRLTVEQPFAGVDAYILDYALIEESGNLEANLLLLNEKEDGTGKAYLLFQRASR